MADPQGIQNLSLVLFNKVGAVLSIWSSFRGLVPERKTLRLAHRQCRDVDIFYCGSETSLNGADWLTLAVIQNLLSVIGCLLVVERSISNVALDL